MKHHNLTPAQWCVDFAQIYADFAKTGLFEGKRVAMHVQPHLCYYPPIRAVQEVIENPEMIESIMGPGDIDPRGKPPEVI